MPYGVLYALRLVQFAAFEAELNRHLSCVLLSAPHFLAHTYGVCACPLTNTSCI